MRKVCLALVFLMLSGCAAPVWETVEDKVPVLPVASWLENAYTVQCGVPSGVELLEQREDWQVYGTADGELEVETRTFLASSLNSAVKTLSGYQADELTILRTNRFGLPEYQFAWVSQTEQGSRLYRADLVLDDTACYAVVCSRPEAAGNRHDREIRQVFSSFGLFTDEGV